MTPLPSSASKRAEQEYLRRAGTQRWERSKPFPEPGHDTVAEGARLIHDFAVALLCLDLHPGERVLDLGAGSCWTSEWLQRFGIDATSVDIAVDMLRIGRDRRPRPRWLVAGDLELLPLRSGSFQAALCLNAFHHVPDGRAALREIRRVLGPGGRVLFSEPGRGHARADASASAVNAFGVQERDVVVSEFLDACREAGFVDVNVKPIVHVAPWYDAGAERWRQWERLAATRRPWRALPKMWRAALEALGAGKRGATLHETLGAELVRIVAAASTDHPIVVARAPAAPP